MFIHFIQVWIRIEDRDRTTRCSIHRKWWSVAIQSIHHHLILPVHTQVNPYHVKLKIKWNPFTAVRRLVALQFTPVHVADKVAVRVYLTFAFDHPIATVASGPKHTKCLLQCPNLIVPNSKVSSAHVVSTYLVIRRLARLHPTSATWSALLTELAAVANLTVATDLVMNIQLPKAIQISELIILPLDPKSTINHIFWVSLLFSAIPCMNPPTNTYYYGRYQPQPIAPHKSADDLLLATQFQNQSHLNNSPRHRQPSVCQ